MSLKKTATNEDVLYDCRSVAPLLWTYPQIKVEINADRTINLVTGDYVNNVETFRSLKDLLDHVLNKYSIKSRQEFETWFEKCYSPHYYVKVNQTGKSIRADAFEKGVWKTEHVATSCSSHGFYDDIATSMIMRLGEPV